MSHILFGHHAVEMILQRNPARIEQLFILNNRQDQKIAHLTLLATEKNVACELKSKQELDALSQNGVHQGVIAICQSMPLLSENDLTELLQTLREPALLLILDGVQDPHNLGACLRSADAAGVHAVIVPKDKSTQITATVSKVACGAAESIPFISVTNLARTMRYLQDNHIWLFGMAGEAKQSLYTIDLRVPCALVLGSEGTGLRRLTRDHCDVLMHLPMQGSVSSLNVSVATGVALFEAVRQRSQ